ncbi:MAG: hypothetical protein II809_06340, partial [Bacteroidales bacterium]|nr:hypothetical protein [Bacteroidales bacterium]
IMIYTYRVTLEGIKGFYRVYKLDGANSLYTFHKRLRADLEFTVDQPILFKAFDAQGNVFARYALQDIGSGSVDMVSIAKTVADGVVKFVYFYDVAARKSVNITLEAEEAGSLDAPELIDTKGPVPAEFENGYVAFEDLPQQHRKLPGLGLSDSDDDDDDEDEDGDDEGDEDDDEKEEIIYDADEA